MAAMLFYNSTSEKYFILKILGIISMEIAINMKRGGRKRQWKQFKNKVYLTVPLGQSLISNVVIEEALLPLSVFSFWTKALKLNNKISKYEDN